LVPFEMEGADDGENGSENRGQENENRSLSTKKENGSIEFV